MSDKAYMDGVGAFLDDLASNSPTPGGGAAAAVLGSIGCALASMVGNLTVGKKKYAEVEDQAKSIVASADALRTELLSLYRVDIEAFDQVSAAFKLPKESDDDKAARKEAIQNALKGATISPLKCAQAAFKGMQSAKQIADIGNANAISDAGVASLSLNAAVFAATLNMRINLGMIKDEAFVAEHDKLANDLETNAGELSAAIRDVVLSKI